MSSYNVCQTSTKCNTLISNSLRLYSMRMVPGKVYWVRDSCYPIDLEFSSHKSYNLSFYPKLRKNSWFREILVFRNNFWWRKFCENSFFYQLNSLTGNILFEISFVWQILLQWKLSYLPFWLLCVVTTLLPYQFGF